MAVIRNGYSTEPAQKGISNLFTAWLNEVEVVALFRTCVSCRNLVNDRHCNKFGAAPPASVVVTGCDSYDDSEDTPF